MAKKRDNRDRTLTIRFSADELAMVERAARADLGKEPTVDSIGRVSRAGAGTWIRMIILDLITTTKAGAADAIRKGGHRPP